MIIPLVTDNSAQIGKENFKSCPMSCCTSCKKNPNPVLVYYWFIEQNQIREMDNS